MASSPRQRAARKPAPSASKSEESPAIGFERLAPLFTRDPRPEATGQSYPPFNVERTSESEYRITLAVSEFEASELVVEQELNVLTVRGWKPSAGQVEGGKREIVKERKAEGSFERRFHLTDDVNATCATLQGGFLLIDLQKSSSGSESLPADKRDPEEAKRVSLAISAYKGKKKVELEQKSKEKSTEWVARGFTHWDITRHAIWKSVEDRYPGARIFRLYVPEAGVFVYDDGKFSANGELLMTVPTTRRNGEPDVEHLTVLLDFGGRARDSFEVESVGLRGEAPIASNA